MKARVAIAGMLVTTNAFAGGLGTQGTGDVYFYLFVIGVLALLLGFNYMSNFIQRIIRDADYRYRLNRSFRTLLSTLREGVKPKQEFLQNSGTAKTDHSAFGITT